MPSTMNINDECAVFFRSKSKICSCSSRMQAKVDSLLTLYLVQTRACLHRRWTSSAAAVSCTKDQKLTAVCCVVNHPLNLSRETPVYFCHHTCCCCFNFAPYYFTFVRFVFAFRRINFSTDTELYYSACTSDTTLSTRLVSRVTQYGTDSTVEQKRCYGTVGSACPNVHTQNALTLTPARKRRTVRVRSANEKVRKKKPRKVSKRSPERAS